MYFDNWNDGFLRDGIELISGQHIDSHKVHKGPYGTLYLTGPADFIGRTPSTNKFTDAPQVCCQKDDILITVKGSGTGSIAIADKVYCISRQLMAVRPTKFDKDFVLTVLEINSKKYSASAKGLVPGITRQDILFTPLKIPPRIEQKGIAKLITTWGIAIEKMERLIGAKNKNLKYLINKLVSDKTYPKSFVRDIATELSVRNNGERCKRVLSVTNTNGFVLPEDQFERRVASEDLSNYKLVCRGQYAYNPSRINVGSIARLDDWPEGVLSPMYIVFILNENKINSDFFLYWLSSYEARERIKRSAQGSVRETVGFQNFGDIAIPLPPLNTQLKIAELLNTAKREIDLLKKQLEALIKQKRGLMQKLLTGEWRVKTATEEE